VIGLSNVVVVCCVGVVGLLGVNGSFLFDDVGEGETCGEF